MAKFKDIVDDWAPALINPTAVLGTVLGSADSILNYIGADKDREAQERANAANAALQREFAQNSIRWKVEDAIAAGLHPLAALGSSGYSASPSHISEPAGEKYRAMGGALAGMGQNISRAISATQTIEERAISQQQIRSMALDNELKALQLKKALENSNAGPPMPSYGPYSNPSQPGGGTTSDAIMGRSDPLQASIEIPPVSSQTFEVTSTGLRPQPSRQLAQANQNSLLSSISWDIDNKVVPMVTGRAPGERPDLRRYPLPKGYQTWKWNRWAGKWQPHKVNPRRFKWNVHRGFDY